MAEIAFQYLEIRHCIFEVDGEVHSFTDEDEFETVRSRLADEDARFTAAWSLYGRYSDGAGRFLAMAIGDFLEKEDAFTVMNALLAPMTVARDLLIDAGREYDIDFDYERLPYLEAVTTVSNRLSDFISQSSDRERM